MYVEEDNEIGQDILTTTSSNDFGAPNDQVDRRYGTSVSDDY